MGKPEENAEKLQRCREKLKALAHRVFELAVQADPTIEDEAAALMQEEAELLRRTPPEA